MHLKGHLAALTLLFGVHLSQAQIGNFVCDTTGNWLLFANYDGGELNIIVDENIPNLKIGICTYEPVNVTFGGAFVGNITQVNYAGFNSAQGNNNCGFPIITSSFSGINPSILTIETTPPVNIISPPNPNFFNQPNGNNSGVVCLADCDLSTYQGGCNTADQVLDVFQNRFGGSLRGVSVQYCCWQFSTPYRISALKGNCCNAGGSAFASIQYPSSPICIGATSAPILPTFQGNAAGTFYANPPGLSINPTTGAIIPANSSTGTYEVVYALNLNCTNYFYRDTITLLGGGSLNTISDSACSAYTTPWGEILTQSGTYFDTLSTSSGCDSIIQLNLNITGPVVLPITTINSCTPYTASWGQTYFQSGIYTDTLRSANACDTISSLQLNVISPISRQILAVGDSLCAQNSSFEIIPSSGLQTVVWNFNDPNSGQNNQAFGPSISRSFSAPGIYTIQAYINDSCQTDTLNYTANILDCTDSVVNCRLYIPNAFSPNADNINDNFNIQSNCPLEFYQCTIYNRWGQAVFQTQQPETPWNGTHQGQNCAPGVYPYQITYKYKTKRRLTQRGLITLFR